MDPIRVFVVDEHPVVRYGVAAMLAGEGSFLWVGQAGDCAEAMSNAPLLAPDVVLVNLSLPQFDGLQTMRALKGLMPQARFVILLGTLDAIDVRRSLAAGAAGVLPKDATTRELLTVIHAAYIGHSGQAGAPWLAPEVAHALAVDERNPEVGADLTPRERELLALMARGLPNHEISAQLSIAMPTVKFHVTNILAKLGAENRTGAVLAALRHKLVGLD